ncbi:hypothetical protein [Ascidiimonas sp. W6]|uniref:hypothetical protein n=1 Tax=Ascidiimonas meishanensis TaxID=3128903 RepID=UPI0030EE84B2
MKTAIQIALWLLSFFFAFMIYKSISEPIEFKKVKEERYKAVIAKLKDIRDAQEAHRTVTGKFASNFDALVKFVDTAQFTITQQRDSSFMEYDEVYKIDMLREVKIIDTLGFKAIKDSIFKNSDRYKTMMNVPFAENTAKFEMKAAILDKEGYKAPVFEAKVKKDVILYDQPKNLRVQENQMISVDEVNGNSIIVGSLNDVSTNGNWPTIYDTKKKN